MTETKALTELLRMIVNEINEKTCVEKIAVRFIEGIYYYIANKFEKDIYSGKLKDIDFSLESMKKFVENSVYGVTTRASTIENIYQDIGINYLDIDNEKYIDILGRGKIYGIYFVEIKDDYKKYIDKIKRNLDGDKFRMVYRNDDIFKGFYIDTIIREDKLNIPYVKDLEKFKTELKKVKNADELKKILDYETVALYYSDVPTAEFECAYDYIEKLVNHSQEEPDDSCLKSRINKMIGVATVHQPAVCFEKNKKRFIMFPKINLLKDLLKIKRRSK